MLRRVTAVALVVGLAAVLGIVAWPQLLDLQRAPVAALAVSFRGASAVAAVGVAVVLTLIGFVLHRSRRFLGAVALVLVAFAVAVAGVQLSRGVGAPDVPVAQANDLTVLSWNTLGDSVPAASIARVATQNGADVVALPETTAARARQVAALLADGGSRFRVFSASQQDGIPSRSTSLLVARSLGAYRQVEGVGDTHSVPSIVVDPSGGQNAPRIVAVHTLAPYAFDPVGWRTDLSWAAARCSGRNVLMAGDFNATIDHFAGLGSGGGQLATCRDAALTTRNAAVGTWPTSMPALVGTPIDHVLATPNWSFAGFRVLGGEDAAGSDHRPVLARLRPAG
ncbi:endonuclease/exonuclease/phosphatase family protein [uncultured Amnibacterium sp.]|uniref:endonuclease/exonuclease/phosphatase family protein n=1 Tax=uncultured Amnibacterium sp. TaxID=1631851 RepID=UPI0035C98E08